MLKTVGEAMSTNKDKDVTPFQAYLDHYNLNPLDVSITSSVRYLTIWNIQHGTPITSTHAARVRLGLLHLTGVPFTAPIATQDTGQENKRGRIHLVKVSHYD